MPAKPYCPLAQAEVVHLLMTLCIPVDLFDLMSQENGFGHNFSCRQQNIVKTSLLC